MANKCYVQKKGDKILEVPLGDWKSYLTTGYVYATEEDFIAQQAGTYINQTPVSNIPTLDNTKKEIVDYAKENDLHIDVASKKEDILWGIAQAKGLSNSEVGIPEDEPKIVESKHGGYF